MVHMNPFPDERSPEYVNIDTLKTIFQASSCRMFVSDPFAETRMALPAMEKQ